MNTCKSPDKIFLPGYIDLPSAAILTLGNQPGDVEYIRKDALLEFLKKNVNEIEIAMETGADDPVLWGQRNAFKQVIDKINAM